MTVVPKYRYAVCSLLILTFAGCGANLTPESTIRGSLLNTVAHYPLRPPVQALPLAPASERVLHRFKDGSDGAYPYAGLLADREGALYGTTIRGGTSSAGTVFKLKPAGSGYTERVVYSFLGGSDGQEPFAGLIADNRGALYGTTQLGGSSDAGIVFKLSPAGKRYTESILYAFLGGSDGARPIARLLAGMGGTLYGTTEEGGTSSCYPTSCGTVFKLTPAGSGYTESVLYRFHYSDGGDPEAGLIADKKGALYSTTRVGGKYGFGTVFKLTPAGKGYAESTLYSFAGGKDGAFPYSGLLVDRGALYGTTSEGGTFGCSISCGTVYKLTPEGSGYTESVLYRFLGGNDGAYPAADVIAGKKGAFYGTTVNGGTGTCSGPGCGTVFKLMRTGSGYTERVLYSFLGTNDGAFPSAGLIIDKTGALYGTTEGNSARNDYGTVFKVTR